jgi:hypothetical protein
VTVTPPSGGGGTLDFRRAVVDGSSPSNPFQKSIADLNGDALPDLIVAGQSGPVVWYQAPGWTKRTISSTASSESGSAVGDIDGNGWVDVVVGKTWYQNNNGGSSWTARTLPHSDVGTHDIVVVDINADGKRDIVIRGETSATVVVYLQISPTSWQTFSLDPGYALNGLDVADLNNDGRPDIVVAGVWLQNPGGNVASTQWQSHLFTRWDPFGFVKVVDMDGDGRRDIVLAVSEATGKLSWFKAPADPAYGTWTENVVATGLNEVHAAVITDFNNDGALDIAASEHEGTGRVLIYLRNGSGWQANLIGNNEFLHNLRGADLGNDGDIDLFGAAPWGTVPVLLYERQ